MSMEQLRKEVAALARRVEILERRRDGGGASLIVYDKELDRVLSEMRCIAETYSAHQNWRAEDRLRFRELKARRTELRRILNIKC